MTEIPAEVIAIRNAGAERALAVQEAVLRAHPLRPAADPPIIVIKNEQPKTNWAWGCGILAPVLLAGSYLTASALDLIPDWTKPGAVWEGFKTVWSKPAAKAGEKAVDLGGKIKDKASELAGKETTPEAPKKEEAPKPAVPLRYTRHYTGSPLQAIDYMVDGVWKAPKDVKDTDKITGVSIVVPENVLEGYEVRKTLSEKTENELNKLVAIAQENDGRYWEPKEMASVIGTLPELESSGSKEEITLKDIQKGFELMGAKGGLRELLVREYELTAAVEYPALMQEEVKEYLQKRVEYKKALAATGTKINPEFVIDTKEKEVLAIGNIAKDGKLNSEELAAAVKTHNEQIDALSKKSGEDYSDLKIGEKGHSINPEDIFKGAIKIATFKMYASRDLAERMEKLQNSEQKHLLPYHASRFVDKNKVMTEAKFNEFEAYINGRAK